MKGIPKSIRLKIAQRRENDPDRTALEESFDLIGYKQVILDNWEKAKMAWMDELNTIKRKVAHPERGRVTIDELDLLNRILMDLKE